LGHRRKCQRISRLAFVTAATSLIGGQPNFARCLTVSWADTSYIHFWGSCPPDGISPRKKFTLRPNLAFLLYWQRYCTALQQRSQPNFVALSRGRHLYSAGRPCTLGTGPHSSYTYVNTKSRKVSQGFHWQTVVQLRYLIHYFILSLHRNVTSVKSPRYFQQKAQ